jgi:hypothetical protein
LTSLKGDVATNLQELRLLEMYVEGVKSTADSAYATGNYLLGYTETISGVAHHAYETSDYLIGYTETVSGVAKQALDKANSIEGTIINIKGKVDIDQESLFNLSLITWGSLSSTAWDANNTCDYLLGYTETISGVAHHAYETCDYLIGYTESVSGVANDAYKNDQYTLSQHNNLSQTFNNISTRNLCGNAMEYVKSSTRYQHKSHEPELLFFQYFDCQFV